ncbi:OmpA family protein [Mucilaginibacter litoreus]|uniref:OmpA family protein n=1 Tax=Mucilaginibacter litoreus TaxID=1048221 RepID=A0ABW3ARH2_9SPHI
MKKKLLTILMLMASAAGYAQYSKDNPRALGDKAFDNKDFYEAAYYYRRAAEGMSLITQQSIPYSGGGKTLKAVKNTKPSDGAYISYRLGESYRGYENYLEAEPWYAKVLEEGSEAQYPLSRLWYGVCLRANQHFDEAIAQLTQFNTAFKGEAKYRAVAEKEIMNCRFAKEQYKYPLLIDMSKRSGSWNSDGSDYAMYLKDGNTYFTSSRFVKDEKTHLNRLYTMKNDGSAEPQVVKFKSDESIKDIEYGTPAFTPDGQRMYFTRWFKIGSKSTYAIYWSHREAGDTWSTPQKLNNNVNAEGYNSIQPFVTADGKQLYFVSTKPGGRGGDDIWVADLDNNGSPLNSVNLGSNVNTNMNEQAPYYDVLSKRLVYSSKGFIGLGGYDFFESYNQNGRWATPVNMGYPMNSAKDDLYYVPDGSNPNKFYISSDRESDCCLNLFEGIDKRYILTGLVVDCNTRKALPGVKVSFVDSLSKQTIKNIVTDATARYTFEVRTNRPYNLVLEKAGYFTKVLPVPASGKMSGDTLYNPEICLQAFKVDKPIVIENVLYDYDKATLRAESKTILNGLVTIMKDNPKIRVELAAHTDSKGTDSYNLRLSYKRAQACVNYIISMGIDESRIYPKGYGERKPIAPNKLPNGKDNPAGRQLNRRTEFTVIKLE